jgi:hypothetical protein
MPETADAELDWLATLEEANMLHRPPLLTNAAQFQV